MLSFAGITVEECVLDSGKNTQFLAKCTFSAGKQFLRKVDFGQMAPNSAEVRGGTIQKLHIYVGPGRLQ